MKNKKDRKDPAVWPHPAPPNSLTQEIPTPDTVHLADVPVGDITDMQVHGPIYSDVLGSYTGSPTAVDRPIQDADDL